MFPAEDGRDAGFPWLSTRIQWQKSGALVPIDCAQLSPRAVPLRDSGVFPVEPGPLCDTLHPKDTDHGHILPGRCC